MSTDNIYLCSSALKAAGHAYDEVRILVEGEALTYAHDAQIAAIINQALAEINKLVFG